MTLVKGRSTLPPTRIPVDVERVKSGAAAALSFVGSIVGLVAIGLVVLRGAA